MNFIILTPYDGKILGPIAKLLGYIMNGIYIVLEKIGIPNTGLAIIIFTVITYLLLTPLTIRQQKFSKLSAKMNPEIQAIQAKYKDKKDQESMARMNDETKAVYAKYGTSPTGGCLQLFIQFPIILALYRVIYSIPGYVTSVKNAFFPLVSKFMELPGALDYIQNTENFRQAAAMSKKFQSEAFLAGNKDVISNTIIDVLNNASTTEWMNIGKNFPAISEYVTNASGTGSYDKIAKLNSFLGLNIGDTPMFIIKDAFANGKYLLVIGAILVPVLAAVTQWINTKLMPQAENNNKGGTEDTMAATMKSMNVTMPIFSAIMCFSFATGIGIYWIAGSVIRSVQQVIINKKLDKIDMDQMIAENIEKANKKREKRGLPAQTINENARISTKAIVSSVPAAKSQEERDEAVRKATEYYSKKGGAKPGSLTAKANMVKQYNEKND